MEAGLSGDVDLDGGVSTRVVDRTGLDRGDTHPKQLQFVKLADEPKTKEQPSELICPVASGPATAGSSIDMARAIEEVNIADNDSVRRPSGPL